MSGYVRLLMTTDAIGGVWQYSLDLCRHLTRRRVEVILAVLGPAPDAYQRRTAGAIGGVSLVEIEGELDWLAPDAASLADSAGRLCRLARERGVGLVHLNAPALNACVDFPVPVVAVSHSCLGTWWDAVRSGPLPPEFAWRNALHAKGLRRAQIVVCPSRSFAGSRVESTRPASGRNKRNAQTSWTSSRSLRCVSGSNSPAHGRSRGSEMVTCAFQQFLSKYAACAATLSASARQSARP